MRRARDELQNANIILEERGKQRTQELNEAMAKLGGLASTDPLTELPNRRAYLGRLDEAIAFWRRRDIPVSVILLDIDRFKALNDTYGHQAVTLFWSLWRKFSAKLRPKSIFRPVWGGRVRRPVTR